MTRTFCHCMPMSPKPPSANWLATILPLLVALAPPPVGAPAPAAGVAPVRGIAGAGPAGGAVEAGVIAWPNCRGPVVIALV